MPDTAPMLKLLASPQFGWGALFAALIAGALIDWLASARGSATASMGRRLALSAGMLGIGAALLALMLTRDAAQLPATGAVALLAGAGLIDHAVLIMVALAYLGFQHPALYRVLWWVWCGGTGLALVCLMLGWSFGSDLPGGRILVAVLSLCLGGVILLRWTRGQSHGSSRALSQIRAWLGATDPSRQAIDRGPLEGQGAGPLPQDRPIPSWQTRTACACLAGAALLVLLQAPGSALLGWSVTQSLLVIATGLVVAGLLVRALAGLQIELFTAFPFTVLAQALLLVVSGLASLGELAGLVLAAPSAGPTLLFAAMGIVLYAIAVAASVWQARRRGKA